MKKIITLFFILISFSLSAQKTITGLITSATDGSTLPGVNISVKGTNNGAISDLEGKYSIIASEGQVIIFSYIGRITQELKVGSATTINIEMAEDARSIDEVVVVGYGTSKRTDVSGASVTVSEEKLKSQVSTSLDQALQGQAAGVTITQTSGNPGASVSMRIRGTSTLSSDAEPLYVVDGVPMTSANIDNYAIGLGSLGGGGRSAISGISNLNPADIQSVEILKDASATAIYGSRGANGVILITTKRGKAGEGKFSYESYYGTQHVSKIHDMLDLQQYAIFHNAWTKFDGGTPKEEFTDPSVLGAGTDWQDALFTIAPMQSHQLSASGGGEKSRYSISAGYFDQDGLIIGSSFKRYSARLNQESDLRKWLKLTTNMSFSSTKENLQDYNGEGVIDKTLKQTPDIPVYNFDGTFASGTGEYAKVNPIALLLISPKELTRNNFTGNLGVDIKPVEWLTLHTEFGGNLGFNNSLDYDPSYNFGPQATKTDNTLDRNKSQSTFYQFNTYLTFSKKIGIHDVTAMIGHEASQWTWGSLSGQANNLADNSVYSISLGDTKAFKAGGSNSSGALESYFGRVTYSLLGKYNLTGTLRRDGSSNFGPNNRWALFPAVAASWRLSEESFIKSLSFIDNLKLRAGWGETGNQNIRGFAYSVSMSTLPTDLGQGFRVTNYPNPNIRWEQSQQFNVGLDMSFLKNRINATVDLYNKTSNDMLMEYPFPFYMGGKGNDAFRLRNPFGNFGEINNKGIELTIAATAIKKEDFAWNIDLVFSKNKNKLVDLGLENTKLDGFVQWETLVSRVDKGQEIGSFYGYKVAGIFQDQADILNSPRQYKLDNNGQPVLNRKSTVWVGDLKYEDINQDGVIDDKDMTYLGSPQPKFTASLRNSFSYKNFELSVFLFGCYGNKVYNYVRQGRSTADEGLDNMRSIGRNQWTTVLGFSDFEAIDASIVYPNDPKNYKYMDDITNVRVKNPNTDMPRITANDPNNNQRTSDRYIEDGSYLRIQNITLSYNFPQTILKYIKLSNLKLYTSIQNAYTFTKYTGLDPEIGQDAMVPTLYGVDNHRYPNPRIYTFGININF